MGGTQFFTRVMEPGQRAVELAQLPLLIQRLRAELPALPAASHHDLAHALLHAALAAIR